MRQEQFTELKNEVPREGFKGMQVPWWHGRYRRKLKILFKSCVRSFARRRTSLPLWPRGSAYIIQMAKRRNGGPPLLSSCTLRSTTTPGLKRVPVSRVVKIRL